MRRSARIPSEQHDERGQGRTLTEDERGILLRVLAAFASGDARRLIDRVRYVRVVSGLPTFLTLDALGAVPAAVKDRPIPVRAIVQSPVGDMTGEILVWVKVGHLSGLEHAWYTHDAPVTMPSPDLLVVG